MGFHTIGGHHWQTDAASTARKIDLGRYAYRTEDIRQRMSGWAKQGPALLEFAPAVLTHPVCVQLQGFALEAEDA